MCWRRRYFRLPIRRLWVMAACAALWAGAVVAEPVSPADPAADAGEPPAQAQRATFTVATYNVNGKVRDLALALEAIRESNADVVCIQEANRESFAYFRRHLAEEYPHFAVQLVDVLDGIAWFSRTPLHRRRWLPRKHGMFGALLVEADLGGRRVQLAGVHLQPTTPAEGQGLREWIEAFQRMEVVREIEIRDIVGHLSSERPMIVLGDLNTPATGRAPRWLRQQRLIDSFASVHENPEQHPTWEEEWLGRVWRFRVDYIFHSAGIETLVSRVIVKPASDHYLVVSQLAWREESADTDEAGSPAEDVSTGQEADPQDGAGRAVDDRGAVMKWVTAAGACLLSVCAAAGTVLADTSVRRPEEPPAASRRVTELTNEPLASLDALGDYLLFEPRHPSIDQPRQWATMADEQRQEAIARYQDAWGQWRRWAGELEGRAVRWQAEVVDIPAAGQVRARSLAGYTVVAALAPAGRASGVEIGGQVEIRGTIRTHQTSRSVRADTFFHTPEVLSLLVVVADASVAPADAPPVRYRWTHRPVAAEGAHASQPAAADEDAAGPVVTIGGRRFRADHVVYVLDRSDEMAAAFDEVRRHVKASIAGLSGEQSFHMVFPGTVQTIEPPQRRLVRADDEQKAAAATLLERVSARGRTQCVGAVARAMEVAAPAEGRRVVVLITHAGLASAGALEQWVAGNGQARGSTSLHILYVDGPTPRATGALGAAARRGEGGCWPLASAEAARPQATLHGPRGENAGPGGIE